MKEWLIHLGAQVAMVAAAAAVTKLAGADYSALGAWAGVAQGAAAMAATTFNNFVKK